MVFEVIIATLLEVSLTIIIVIVLNIALVARENIDYASITPSRPWE